MQHKDALQRVRNLPHRPEGEVVGSNALSGPTLIEQEPDLAKEAAKHNLAVSGWSAGGQAAD